MTATNAKRGIVSSCARCGAGYTRSKRHNNSGFCSVTCRFLAKTTPSDDGCWNWTASQDGHGYGQINIDGRIVKAHRWSAEHIGGTPLLPGLVLDHLCRNRACVNPEHLRQVTNRENCLAGEAPSILTHREGKCRRGHSMAGAPVRPDGSPTCRTCENARQRAYYHARKANKQ